MSSSREEPYSAKKMLLYFHLVELTFNSSKADSGIFMESIYRVSPSVLLSMIFFVVGIVAVQSQFTSFLLLGSWHCNTTFPRYLPYLALATE